MAVDVMTGVEHMIAGKMYWAGNMFGTTFCGVETSLAERGEEDSANPFEATFNFPGSVSITPDGSTLFVVSWGRSLPSNDARGSPRIRKVSGQQPFLAFLAQLSWYKVADVLSLPRRLL